MSTHFAPSPRAYKQSAVLTATPGQLVVMAYDGAIRFLHQAPFGGNMFSPYYFVVDFIIIQLIGLLSYRLKLASQMVSRYGWLFQKAGPVSWDARPNAG